MNDTAQVLSALKIIFSFTVGKFLSHNPIDNIKKGLVRDSYDGRALYVCPMRSMSLIKDIDKDPMLMIHESTIIPEAIAFWYHGLNCAELINPFVFSIEYEGKEYELTAFYDKSDNWYNVSGEILNIIWKKVSNPAL